MVLAAQSTLYLPQGRVPSRGNTNCSLKPVSWSWLYKVYTVPTAGKSPQPREHKLLPEAGQLVLAVPSVQYLPQGRVPSRGNTNCSLKPVSWSWLYKVYSTYRRAGSPAEGTQTAPWSRSADPGCTKCTVLPTAGQGPQAREHKLLSEAGQLILAVQVAGKLLRKDVQPWPQQKWLKLCISIHVNV